MQLRSAKLNRVLFSTPVASLQRSPGFSTPSAEINEGNQLAEVSVSEQCAQQDARRERKKMAQSIAALTQCMRTSQGKIYRIQQTILASQGDRTKFNIHAIKLYVKTVDAAYDEFNGFLNQMYISDPSARDEFEPMFLEFEELYESVSIAISEITQYHEDQKLAAVAAREEQKQAICQPGGSGQQNQFPIQMVPCLLMQQAPLPTFDGQYENWYKFRDRFIDIVEKCTRDSPATKLHYLDKALVGKAKGSIDQQTLNDNNYEGAWRILTKKYENLRMVVQGHITQLLSMKAMTKGTHVELRALIDLVEKRLESLDFHGLKMEDALSEAILVNLVISRLDPDTRRAWEPTVEHGQLPAFEDVMRFLREHCYMLERCEQTAHRLKNPTIKTTAPAVATKVYAATVQQANCCPICKDDHLIDDCDLFKKLNVNSRYTKARQLGLCFACLRRGHRTLSCKVDKKKLCECKKKHHPLMHAEEKPEAKERATGRTAEQPGSSRDLPETVAKCETPLLRTGEVKKQVLLATALVDVVDSSGVAFKCRALMDSGAMANFVSERLSDVLCLPKKCVNIPIVGVNGSKSIVKSRIHATVKSSETDCTFSLDFLVVPRVTGSLPSRKLDVSNWPLPKDIRLADPKFFEPNRIDMLIGSEMFYDLMEAGKIRMSAELPLLQESRLGWLVAGPVHSSEGIACVRVHQVMPVEPADERLDELMKRFWCIEEQFPDEKVDNDCEQHFQTTHARRKDGRYVVQLPFRVDAELLGESRNQAVKRFKALEKRLEAYPNTKQMYSDFIKEYIELGHARYLSAEEATEHNTYYLPHHCVMKPDSSTTKLRVVFDASAKTTTNYSLNDVLMSPPTIQSSLFDIILKWRSHKYVYTADVQRMYRQVIVDDSHTKYQRCVWRDDKTQPIRDLEIVRVTYGIGPAGFLATRAMVQLANDEQHRYPAASEVVRRAFYVDDVLSGGGTLAETKLQMNELTALLREGGFKLHKFCANDPALLKDIPPGDQEKQLNFEDNDINGVIKTLGLLWDPVHDDFLFQVQPMKNEDPPTKRQVLSEIARLFDPLGVLGPTVVLAKLVMQRLWQKQIGWDDLIPDEDHEMWKKLRLELCQINDMRIPRRTTIDDPITLELHGFSDASKYAYGCCVYLRSVSAAGSVEVRLLCGKSRVAPLKELNRKEKENADTTEMTIPRLELCAALLLSEQVQKVRETLEIGIENVILRSDSKIVLDWLNRVKPEQSSFVHNRVKTIRKLTAGMKWMHVGTKDNPADLVSRGVYPIELVNSAMWWDGPNFLHATDLVYESVLNEEEEFGQHPVEMVAVAVRERILYDEIADCSRFRRLERVFGYVARFIYNCRSRKRKVERRSGKLDSIDYRDSLLTMVRITQHVFYREEIKTLRRNCPVTGKLRNLNPFYDEEEGVLRVGGRIRNADLPRDQKHPMILPENNHFTDMLVESIHREQLHVGLNGLLAKIRQQFWPVNAKRTIHRVIRKCIKCFRMRPKEMKHFMGDLPKSRVTETNPFTRTGVDYAGPFLLKQGRMRSPIKCYVSVFVCMSTKAIHLELVGSLSTESFLGAFHRFVGRRGNVSEMYSDHGTNFQGAKRQLAELDELFKSQMFECKLEEFCQSRGIRWSFIAPRAPHQGGLWEAGVKSMKSHLCKVLNESYLTYEEMYTLLVQIEAILNSRPLIPQSDDPMDYVALSPGHFLIGRELTAVAEPVYCDLKQSKLSRYQQIQVRKQSFWRRWSAEYITELQRRGKWCDTPTQLREGLLVVIKEDGVPPQQWRLARIVQVHPGADAVVRVVSLRTSSGAVYTRPTTKIAVLPVEESSDVPAELSRPAPGGGC
ncbi:uncharacterized protein LOC129759094 [Uranotaenia lowii]|uniref:uncharacterized protein LOC129759094 n=1 Tax=Uranotaenia lowii TaxID=190385 RepID=UPI00247A67A1|nr:uncharacterized protein LOC129759094 [Uranotaenia lowii]